MSTKDERLDVANEIIKIISRHGRHFFSLNSDKRELLPAKENRISCFLPILPDGKIWFLDKWTNKQIYTHYRGEWRGFSDGGTLRRVVEMLRDYILGKDEVNMACFGPWPQNCCRGDLWGYGDEMETVRKEIKALLSAHAEAA